CQQHDTYPRTF
nr:immunoglobulin light chain junction region [Macaca mulatta]MOX49460.1 immunoglobulin light chain junction region [Macaca mulatta]